MTAAAIPVARRRKGLPGFAALMVLASVVAMTILVVFPLLVVFQAAFAEGLPAYLDALKEPDARAALRLTLLVAAISVPLNAVFGVAAAWLIARFEFRGKSVLLTLIDLPFSISPVVSETARFIAASFPPRGPARRRMRGSRSTAARTSSSVPSDEASEATRTENRSAG